MDDDLRSTIEAATSAVESGATVETPSAAPVAPSATPSGSPQTPAGGVPAPGVAPPATPLGTTPPATPPLGEKGTPAQQTTDPVKQNIGTVAQLKAPGTWTPQAREKWDQLHPEVQQEIAKRERETSRAMTQSQDARKFKSEFDQAVQPFMGFIAAEKSNPIAATVNLMQTAAMLRTGTPTQKAQVVAEVIKNFGIDLMTLDGLLAGQAPQGPQAAQDFIAQAVRQQVTPLLERLTRQEQEQVQAIEADVDQELSEFASDPAHEFYSDVKDLMADILELDAKRGGNMGLTEAYQRATLLSEPVRSTLESRKAGQSAQQAHRVAQVARSGAISVKPSDETGVTGTPPPGDSIRDTLNWAFEKTSGR